MKPIRLVVLLQDLEFGGTQRYAIHLLKNLDRTLFSPELWVLRGGDGLVPLARETGVDITWLSQASEVGPKAIFSLLVRLIRQRPPLLYTLTVVPNIWGRIFGKITGLPAIVSGYRALRPKQYERWLWPISRRIICNAQALKKTMIQNLGVKPERIAVIPNGVDTSCFHPNPKRRSPEPTVLYIGRLVNDKDPMTLLEAFSLVVEKLPKARLDMVGDGGLKDKAEAFIRSRSLEGRVVLHPGQADVRPFMEKAWVFTLASAREGSPNVVLEAMAAGLPVAATRVGGVPELVTDRQTGLLTEPGDPQSLAQAMLALLENESKREAMGRQARKRIQSFHSPEKMARETEAVLLDAVEKTRSGHQN